MWLVSGFRRKRDEKTTYFAFSGSPSVEGSYLEIASTRANEKQKKIKIELLIIEESVVEIGWKEIGR